MRRASRRGLEGDPTGAVERNLRPLMRLVGTDDLPLGAGGDGPAGNHPRRYAYQPGEDHECATETAARAFLALEQEPVNGIAAKRRLRRIAIIGEPVSVFGLQVLLDRLDPAVVRGLSPR